MPVSFANEPTPCSKTKTLRQPRHNRLPPLPLKVRVTPEELAAAVTALQIRKEGQPGTIAIGDAVEELGLDVTPEEVLAEVQARRTKQGHLKTRPFGWEFLGRIALVSAAAGLLGCGLWLFLDPPQRNGVRAMPTAPFVPIVSPNPVHLTVASDTIVASPDGKLRLLWEVGDNQPVHCGFDLQGSAFTQFSPANADNWTLIKHNGRVYVRGRILKMSREVLLHNGADVTAVDNDPQFVVPVTLPLDGFTAASGAGSNVEFHANSVHLDKHAYEKW